MKKYILLFLVIVVTSNAVHSQVRGVRIGYIDMEYILQNVPDYMEAKNQLEQKAQRWKQEIELKRIEINNLKDALKTEQVLLTKELIQERNEEILFQEQELLDYQQKRFGPSGDLATQKAILAQPVQDQVFSSVQDIAEAKKYDFIFDKSSDLTMLFTAKRYDISDQVIRAITRSSKRSQLSKKQLKEEEAKEALEDAEVNPNVEARQKLLDEKKAARDKLIEDRKLANEEKKRLAAEKRQATIDARAGKTAATETVVEESSETVKTGDATETSKKVVEETTTEDKAAEEAAIARQKVKDDRAALLAEKRAALEAKKQKVIADREAAKKAKDEKAAADREAAEKENKTN